MSEEDFLKDLQKEADLSRDKVHQLNTTISSSNYQAQENPNSIEFQLDSGEMLGKVEHFLRGEYISIDKEGNEFWAKPMKKVKQKNGKFKDVINHDLILFNEYGVNAIMSIIGNYLDKNTVLSFYDEMRINEILGDLGDELSNFIYCNYEQMGMNTNFKKTRFQLTVITILHSIESTYRRALGGKTMQDLNSSNIFTQIDNIGDNRKQREAKGKFNLFKSSTW